MALAAMIFAGAGQAQAQDATITGKVTGEQGRPLAGASVFIAGLNIGTNTTASGTYSFTVAASRANGQTVTLRARFVGYTPVSKDITLSSGVQSHDFALVRDAVQLSEVVVTGVSDATDTKKLAFAVGVVTADALKDTPATSALGGLNGKVAGVHVLAAGGSPGTAPAVKLRSATSLTGKQDPLIIIDGTISRASLADINSEDIERIEVVKGAAASSLYGSDAANGVVQIFTKRGANAPEGEMTITLRNEYGQSSLPKRIGRTLAHDYLVDANGDYILNASGGRQEEVDKIADNPYKTVYDQQGDALTKGQFFTNYISIGQRKGATNYNASFQNTKQEGILLGLRGFTRQNFRLNLDQTVNDRFDLSMGAFFGKSNNQTTFQGTAGPFFALTFLEPDVDLKAKNPDGTPYIAKIPFAAATGTNASNPLYQLANQDNQDDRRRFTGTLKGRYRIFDWLNAEANYNYDEARSTLTQVQPKGFLDNDGQPGSGNLYKDDSTTHSINTGLTLTSVRAFGPVTNTTKASYLFEGQQLDNFNLNAGAFIVNRTPEFGAVDRSALLPGSRSEAIRNQNTYLISTFDIMDRYIIDGLIRRDESSLFGKDNRAANYYRVSGAWRVSEDFHMPGIDEFRLRSSYGTAGLRPVYAAQYETFSLAGGTPEKVTLGNTKLKPAKSAETEVGFNLDFLQRYGLEYTFSKKVTTDQILLVPLPAATGYKDGQWQNAGTLEGTTNEAAFRALLADRGDFSWRLNVTGDRTRQKITKLDRAPFLVGPGYGSNNEDNDKVTRIFRIAEGETFGVMYGARTVRDIQDLYDDPAKAALSGPGQEWSPDSVLVNEEGYVVRKSAWRTIGELPITYVDPRGEKVVQIGDVNPDFNMSFNTNMSFKGFNVSGLVDWVQGGNIYNGTRQWPFFEYRDRIYDQRGKPEEEKKPLNYYAFFYNSINPIDFFVEDGSYVKLKELAVNYSIPTTFLGRMRMGRLANARVGIVGRNLWTSTNYSGYDPEVAGIAGDPYSFRFDGFSYPNFKTFTAVVELGF